jgi:hypothetical protein
MVREGRDDRPSRFVANTDPPGWPRLDGAALHGPVGSIVVDSAPHTEADPAHLLVATLVAFGGAVGSTPHMRAGNMKHPPRLHAVLAGATAKARKGTATTTAREFVWRADPDFIDKRSMSGWNSGEAVIDELVGSDDSGFDHRLLIDEAEYARVLAIAGRDGSILSPVMRDAWDGKALATRSRARKAVAKEHHVVVIGQITVDELRARLTALEQANGFGNRHLFVLGRRSKLLAGGGNVPERVVQHHGAVLRDRITAARRVGLFKRTKTAERIWKDIYAEIAADDPPGLLGAVIARGDAQTLRLSLTYALLDASNVVDEPHVRAAYAVWRYCRDSAAYLFGEETTGNPDADQLLAVLLEAGPEGLDATAQFAAFGRHRTAAQLALVRQQLRDAGLIDVRKDASDGGRPRLVAIHHSYANEANQAKKR